MVTENQESEESVWKFICWDHPKEFRGSRTNVPLTGIFKGHKDNLNEAFLRSSLKWELWTLFLERSVHTTSYFCVLSLKVLTLHKTRIYFSLSFLGLSRTVVQVVHATNVPSEEISGGQNSAQVLPPHAGCPWNTTLSIQREKSFSDLHKTFSNLTWSLLCSFPTTTWRT